MTSKPVPSEDFVAIRETLPRLWWNIYQGAIQTGFNQEQSMWLLGVYIMANAPAGVTIQHFTKGPASDDPGE